MINKEIKKKGKTRFLFTRFLFLVLCLACFLYFNTNKIYGADNTLIKLSNKELPRTIIAFNVYCARPDFFEPIDESAEEGFIIIKNFFSLLEDNFKSLECNIPSRMGFTSISFIVQNNIIGDISGYVRVKNKTLEESKVPFESILFITTPIESFNNCILVILSSVSPERTSIISVDNYCKMDLLYDSFKKKAKDENSLLGIGSIYNIRVVKTGVFLLEERWLSGSYPDFNKSTTNRSFIVDVSTGIFKIALKQKEKKCIYKK